MNTHIRASIHHRVQNRVGVPGLCAKKNIVILKGYVTQRNIMCLNTRFALLLSCFFSLIYANL